MTNNQPKYAKDRGIHVIQLLEYSNRKGYVPWKDYTP